MHPELKAYVEAVCDTVDGVQPARIKGRSNRGEQLATTTPKNFFTVIADFLAELPPYYCELKMVPRVKRTKTTSQHHDAIGYHGLV